MKLRSLAFAGFVFLALPFASSFGQVGISVNIAPPILPVYEQPVCPVAGYIWTPGYWGWDAGDYYWVPGVWVPPPRVGLLWTPAWWGWNNGAYIFHEGYWGPTVGFYGGINYGFGYTGNGYWGGRWSGNTFQYNTAVTRVNTNVVRNTYVNNSFNQVNTSRTSFNGGNGIKAEPTAEQKAALTDARKMGPTSEQVARQQAASKDQNLRASVNKGNPNADAINSFNRREGAGQGKGAQELGAAGAAGGAAGTGNKPENLSGRQGQGAAGAGGGNKTGNASQRNLHGARAGKTAGAGNAGANENKFNTGTQGNRGKMGENQAKMRTGKMGGAGGPAPHGVNQVSRNPQTGARNAQMGGKHPQMGGRPPQMGGGNRPHPSGQQQGKKKGRP